MIAAGVALAIAVVGFQLTRGGGAGAAPEPAASATQGAIAAPAPAATVDVWISVEPGEARVFLDDLALGSNPFHSTMARSALARRLRVSAPGYATDERLVALDRDVHLELALKPVAPVQAAPSSTVAAAPVAAAAPAHGGAAPAPKGPPQLLPSAAPGEAIAPTPKKPTRSIDDTF